MTKRSARGVRSVRTTPFKRQSKKLPSGIQDLMVRLFKVFQADPSDPRLETEPLYDTRRSRHRTGSRSIHVTLRYRAIYVIDKGKNGDEDEQYCWYWVGSHEDYNNFVDAGG